MNKQKNGPKRKEVRSPKMKTIFDGCRINEMGMPSKDKNHPLATSLLRPGKDGLVELTYYSQAGHRVTPDNAFLIINQDKELRVATSSVLEGVRPYGWLTILIGGFKPVIIRDIHSSVIRSYLSDYILGGNHKVDIDFGDNGTKVKDGVQYHEFSVYVRVKEYSDGEFMERNYEFLEFTEIVKGRKRTLWSDSVHIYGDIPIGTFYSGKMWNGKKWVLTEPNVFPYHSKDTIIKGDISKYDFIIGFEVEKVDKERRDKCNAQTLLDMGFRKEEDGSLGESGFEFILPAAPLFWGRYNSMFRSKMVQEMLDANFTQACGGHIHISCKSMPLHELFWRLRDWSYALSRLWPERIDNVYCKYSYDNYIRGLSERYSGVYKTSRTVELRFPGPVKNLQDLLARRELLKIVINNLFARRAEIEKIFNSDRVQGIIKRIHCTPTKVQFPILNIKK